ncbi:MAG TPA: hypothetical protein VN643_01920 [Pyrinomonadaceae bacterium]|nr:hypothetical protein [Pyrinomonadaceae bacterium]
MSDFRQRLLELYSRGPVEEVHALNDYQTFIKGFEGNRTLDAERSKMQERRSMVDQALSGCESIKDQIEAALRLLYRRLSADEKEDCLQLIKRSYAKQWSAAQQSYFESNAKRFLDYLDYFLSFTNRSPAQDKPNPINESHDYFLRKVMKHKPYKNSDYIKQNLVADTIHYLLSGQHLQGFHHPDHEGDNQKVEAKLRENCNKAFAFVQLVQAEIFHDAPNWCFFEYQLVENEDKKIIFIEIERPEEDAPKAHPNFKSWYQASQLKDSVKLLPTPDYSAAALAIVGQNRLEIIQNVKSQIRRTINQIYIQIPN